MTGQELRAARLALGMTRRQLGAAAGRTLTTIYRLETGRGRSGRLVPGGVRVDPAVATIVRMLAAAGATAPAAK